MTSRPADLDEDVLGVLGEPAGVGGVVGADGQEELLLVVAMERRLANEHLIQQHPERPPVYRAAVLLAQQDLEGKQAAEGRPEPSMGGGQGRMMNFLRCRDTSGAM